MDYRIPYSLVLEVAGQTAKNVDQLAYVVEQMAEIAELEYCYELPSYQSWVLNFHLYLTRTIMIYEVTGRRNSGLQVKQQADAVSAHEAILSVLSSDSSICRIDRVLISNQHNKGE